MKINVLKEKMSELVALFERKEDATLQFNAACDAIAKEADCDLSGLKKSVAARHKDKLGELKTKTEDALAIIDAATV